MFRCSLVDGALEAGPEDMAAFLAHLAAPAHRDEYRRPCNRAALSADAAPDTCRLIFAPGLSLTCQETTFGRGGLGYRM